MTRDKYIVIYVENGLTRWHDSSFYMETLQFAEDLGKKEYYEFSKHAGVKCFAVNSDIKVNAMCPAYKEVNGKVVRNAAMTCEKCGLCTSRKAAKIIGCLEH